jgi:pSer/pThr/pTyr-binding forkhead associated (FHA) protein
MKSLSPIVVVFRKNEKNIDTNLMSVSLDSSKNRWLIGRDKFADIIVADPFISRKHCTIVQCRDVNDVYYGIVDGLLGEQIGSVYGIWKHNCKIKSTLLQHNDEIQIAPSVFIRFIWEKEDGDDESYKKTLS